jgi:hypothetical protein
MPRKKGEGHPSIQLRERRIEAGPLAVRGLQRPKSACAKATGGQARRAPGLRGSCGLFERMDRGFARPVFAKADDDFEVGAPGLKGEVMGPSEIHELKRLGGIGGPLTASLHKAMNRAAEPLCEAEPSCSCNSLSVIRPPNGLPHRPFGSKSN